LIDDGLHCSYNLRGLSTAFSFVSGAPYFRKMDLLEDISVHCLPWGGFSLLSYAEPRDAFQCCALDKLWPRGLPVAWEPEES
jgi:hypothetical protein